MADTPRRSDADLAELVEELSGTLSELRSDLGDGRREPTPSGVRDLLRFTESYTIPTLVSLLETTIRSLELLQATLRLVDGRGLETGSGSRYSRPKLGPGTGERASAVRDLALSRVDDALADLQSALEGGEPPDEASRVLLEDARALQREIDTRLAESRSRAGSTSRGGRETSAGHEIPVHTEGDAQRAENEQTRDSGDTGVDVEAELETIKRELDTDRDVEGDDSEAGSTTDGPDDGEGGDESDDDAR